MVMIGQKYDTYMHIVSHTLTVIRFQNEVNY